MSGLLFGGLFALMAGGVLLTIFAFVRHRPDLGQTLRRLNPYLQERQSRLVHEESKPGLGSTILRRLPRLQATLPLRALYILKIDLGTYVGIKAVAVIAGIFLPSVLGILAWALGVSVSWSVPALFGLIAGLAGWVVPDLIIRSRSTHSQYEFRRAVCAYIDLVVLARLGRDGIATAIKRPADLADAPLFRHIRTALARQTLQRKPSWQALQELAAELELSELDDLAHTLEISETQSTSVANTLTAQASSIRNRHLNADIAAAESGLQRQGAAVGLLLFSLMIFLIFPAVVALFSA